MKLLKNQVQRSRDGRIREYRAWAELDDGWVAYLRFARQAQRMVLAEVRVLPNTEADATTWTGALRDVPEGGLPIRLLQQIRLREIVRDLDKYSQSTLPGHGLAEAVLAALRGWDPDDVEGSQELSAQDRAALLAAEYVQRVGRGERDPNARIAARWGRTAGWVAQELYRARNRFGLLTPAPERGRPGGQLTEKAVAILWRLGEEWSE